LGFLGKLARFFDLLLLPGDAFAVNAGFDDQVERVLREAEFPLRNRRPSLGSFHNGQV
jgi:hypothetical protein